MAKPAYKTTRKYKCPYCDYKALRGDIVEHVDKKHSSLIPEDYSAARAVYDFINGKNHNVCMICKKPVYDWNEKINRYNNLCEDPKCRARVREIALERHIRVYNKPTLLNDAEHQEKMLAHRKISGSYTFSDGGKITYTGQYEKADLEFMDKVLEIPSKDIQAPGPVLEYEYNGEKHQWITDIYYIPGNLLIEVKDGGSNPNKREMPVYREKQIAKEEMVTNLGTFNYIRLTNNDFAQLLDILADMKNEALSSETDPKAKIHINEEVGGLPPHRPPVAYAIPCGMNNAFSGFAYSDSDMDKFILSGESGELLPLVEEELFSKYQCGPTLFYSKDDAQAKIDKIHEAIRSNEICSYYDIMNILTEKDMHSLNDIICCECFKFYDKNREAKIESYIKDGITRLLNENTIDSAVVDTVGHVYICQSPKGYYAATPGDFYMASEYFSTIEDLKAAGIVDFMNGVYDQNSKKEIVGGEDNA